MPPHPSPSICSRCSYRLQWHRGFSSTAQRRAVPPESTSFIHVPEPVQAPKYDDVKPVKGVLPVSRDVFNTQKKKTRAAEMYKVKFNPPEPHKRPEPRGPEADRIKYKQQMSFIRRQTLREGMTELRSRLDKTNDRLGKTGGLKQIRNRRAAAAPAPLDEILTNPSIHPSARLLMATGNAAGPKDIAPSKVPQHEAKRSLERRKALHNLYVNAQHFIVNEQQLNEEIEKVFGSDTHPLRWEQGNSVWALSGKPLTASEMLSLERKGAGTVADDGAFSQMKKLTEALTGGKMSEIGGPKDDQFSR